MEVEGGQAQFAGNLRPALFPLESSRDHQVNDEKQTALEFEDDLLAQAAKSPDAPPMDCRDRGSDRSHNEWTRQPHALEGLIEDPRLQRFHVQQNIRQL